MKIAIGIISIFLGMLVLLQSCTVGTASEMLGDQATSEAGAVGMLVGLLYFVGGAFAFGLPVVTMVALTLAGLLGFAAASSGSFSDLTMWAVVALVLAVGAFFSWRSGRKAKAAQNNV
ncbi:hypothetical protein [Sinorhizobium mexicanum]|uniref:Uncharacterized protein n=1 Tax=Sinorhizobium mexicanum TaxID=375549 RepID=A0A859QLL4_9HYPH|nr:hypothetical protein [Sinorhizobium mexicanum]MBP1885727.1 hypothetical protein [Sinorhizobium mexicanum]QLL63470.1 hypothetical protein FKV68_19495 [Sinorhizobium mexicanum]